MCRLFGFRSNTAAAVHESLLREKNALQVQSREHKDGWGIAFYGAGVVPEVAHGLGPAHADKDFDRVASLVSSHTVLAHVRLASVGAVEMRNAHPFTHGSWAFAHNGTIQDFASHQAAIEARIDPGLRERIAGETDSERCFYLFLTRLQAAVPASRPASADEVARALAEVTRYVASLTDRADKPSSMNFMVTDGKLLVASRRRRTLFYSEQRKHHAPHPEPKDGAKLSQLVIASEQLSSEDHWHEIPEDSIVAVDADMKLRRWMTAELQAPRH